MGFAKNEVIEDQERGWSTIDDKYVCPHCIEDEYRRASAPVCPIDIDDAGTFKMIRASFLCMQPNCRRY